MLTLLHVFVTTWYDPSDKMAFHALLTGTPRSTETMKQNRMLWEILQILYKSAALPKVFQSSDGGAFFHACAETDHPDARTLTSSYQEFISFCGQRGMPDCEIFFPQRCEDPSIDYRALEAMPKTPNAQNPAENEHATNVKREEFASKVIAKIARSTFGLFKAELFKIVLDWCNESVIVRDDERHYLDVTTLSIRRAFMEVGRRLTEYGIFQSIDDVWFLSKLELFAAWDVRK